MFLELLLNPPHLLDVIITRKVDRKVSLEELVISLAAELCCAFELLDAAASFFALTSKQTVIVGLVKEITDSSFLVEIKTIQDVLVLDWIKTKLDLLQL